MKRCDGRIGTTALVLLALLAPPLGAQTGLENRMGFVGGATMATWAGDGTNDPDWRMGGDVGAFVSWVVDDPWALRAGLYYVQKGIRESDADGDATLTLDYLEIPLLLEYRLVSEGPLGVHVFGGPAVALKLGCRVEAITVAGATEAQCSVYGMSPREMDTGIMVGAGANYAVTTGVGLLLEARFNLGVGSIDDSYVRADVKNRAFQVNLGVVIPTGEWIGSR